MKERRILLVDDDRDIVETFQSILKKAGFFVETAMTGREAIDKARRSKFDLVLLDIKLPDIMGDMVASKIREQDDEVSMIMITGYPSFQKCIDSLDLGISEILLKPISAGELISVIVETIRAK
ncbi:MAG: response regulator [Candidatus Bathyarchaeia archaeon]